MPKTHEKVKNQIPFGVKILLLLGVILLLSIFLNVYFTLYPQTVRTGHASIPGDCGGPNGTADGYVDLFDYGNLSRSFGLTQGQQGFNAACDFYVDSHNIIDLLDYGILAQNFGRSGNATSTPRPTITVTPGPTSPTSITHDQLKQLVLNWKNSHTGQGGKQWDINNPSLYPDSVIESNAQLKTLVSVCGNYHVVRPVYPLIAWEYGGADHPWINPNASALVYCVYIPVRPTTSHWTYDPNFVNLDGTHGRVTGDMWVLYPDYNPCKNQVDKYQVLNCLGDPTNSEILVDTMSFWDGVSVGYDLSVASTRVMLILADGRKVELLINQ